MYRKVVELPEAYIIAEDHCLLHWVSYEKKLKIKSLTITIVLECIENV